MAGGSAATWFSESAERQERDRIEAVAKTTNTLGAQKLADQYGELGGVRMPDDVRVTSECGDLYSWLVQQRKPKTVVEFGSAFGVSGMYFGGGLAAAQGWSSLQL